MRQAYWPSRQAGHTVVVVVAPYMVPVEWGFDQIAAEESYG